MTDTVASLGSAPARTYWRSLSYLGLYRIVIAVLFLAAYLFLGQEVWLANYKQQLYLSLSSSYLVFSLVALGLAEKPLRMLGTFGSVVVATVHVLLPFMMLPIASALQALDPAMERAAQSLGATPAQTFWRVTLPLSMPGVLAGTSLVIALTLGIGAETVKWHLKNLFSKLSAGTREHAVDRARLLGLLEA